MKEFKLDRTAFKMHHTNDNCNNYDIGKLRRWKKGYKRRII